MATKRIVIYRHNGGRLANQLWNSISIYAYCLEKGYTYRNYCFFDYSRYFKARDDNKISAVLIFLGLRKLNASLYRFYQKLIQKFRGEQILSDGTGKTGAFYLPPSRNKERAKEDQVEWIEKSPYNKIYMKGWLFRNPVGIERFRAEIKERFRPAPYIERKIDERFGALRSKYGRIIGVHIRLEDPESYIKPIHFVLPETFLAVMKQFLSFKGYAAGDTLFVICSNQKIDPTGFNGLNVSVNDGNLAEDLFTLAKTDAIIASHSTFSAFAAYYGNIPFMLVDNTPVDWEYYRGKETHFSNKYDTMVNY